MGEYLSPDVYVEEVESGEVEPAGISTTNGGFCGFTPRGPVNDPQLITSWPQFVREMGGFTALSELPSHVFAFFANGGRRAWISRQVGAGAVAASGVLSNPVEEELLDTGDGVTVAFNGTLDNIPVNQIAAGGSISVSTYVDGVPVVGEAGDFSPVPAGVVTSFTGKLGAAADTPIVPGTVTIDDTQGGGPAIAYNDNGTGGLVDAAAPGVVVGYIDYQTGHFTIECTLAPILPGHVTYDYTPRGAAVAITDDGAGGWNAPAVAGAINYTTGVWSLTFAAAPSNGWEILADYTQENAAFTLEWEGLKGNDIRVTVDGEPGYYTPSTASWSAGRVRVYEENGGDGNFVLQETFSNVNFDTPTDPRYIATLLNDADQGSDLITVSAALVDDEIPQSLNGLARTRSVGGGEGTNTDYGSSGATPTIAQPFVTDPLSTPIQPRSVSFTYTGVSGTARTITDDGAGNLIGDVDATAPAGYNVIDYTTGEFAFRVADPPDTAAIAAAGSLIAAAWYETPNDTSVSDDASGGTDGTLPLTSAELTAAGLVANNEGIYALSTIEELLTVVVPRAAGDTTMTEAILAEAKRVGRWFVIVAPPSGYTPAQVIDWRQNVLSYLEDWGALYYPWIRIQDPITNLPKTFAPGGHIAGKYAYNDVVAHVGKTPAGKKRGTLSWLLGLERDLDKGERDAIYPYQINILRDDNKTGRAIWGARTLESPAADFRFINARRVVNFIKLSLYSGAFDFPFEDIGEDLWERCRLYAENFLMDLYRQKYFRGSTPKQALFVICDGSNNDPDDNKVFIDVGVATTRPAEFVVFRVQLIAETSE